MISVDELDAAGPAATEELMMNFHLSEREREVANHVIQGLHNSQIADKLFISEVTVKKHLQNIFLKTGVDNRAALVHAMLVD
jgi:DNA-binding NarL/FixJ family response regulator